MDFYMSSIILIELLMITMTLHVIKYSGFSKNQKIWYLLTFLSIFICSLAEYLVHCGWYDPIFKIPLTIITIIQFSISPLLAVFFSGALGLHKEAKIALHIFLLNALVEIIMAPFGLIFYFNDEGYFRGQAFLVYEIFYFVGIAYLVICLFVAGRRFNHRDSLTVIMILVILTAGVIPMTISRIHTAYISIAICSCICYIYYNDLVQEDIRIALVSNEKKINFMQEHMISGLANLIESRDADTGSHVNRTSVFAKKIAESAMNAGVYKDQIDEKFVSLMYRFAPMHDVGKILVSDTILCKPGKLTPEEYETMKIHAARGGEIVRSILDGVTDESYIRFAEDIATYHHEWWNGNGYPHKLKGEDIPLSARIMAIADVFDALVSERCYKKALPVKDAIEIIKNESGTHFDPKLVDVFLIYAEREHLAIKSV